MMEYTRQLNCMTIFSSKTIAAATLPEHRNQDFNIPLDFGFILYGWWGHITYGLYKRDYDLNDELRE